MLDRINVILHFTTNNRRWGGGTGRWPQHVNTYYKYKCKYKSIMWLQDQFTECFLTGWKVSKYGVPCSPYFHGFWLNMEVLSLNLCIQSEYEKVRTKKNFIFGYFSSREVNNETSTNVQLVSLQKHSFEGVL